MRFRYDHDLHIHSYLSPCAGEEGRAQTAQAILDYAIKNQLHTICVTDHFWDETVFEPISWYRKQNFPHIAQILPLPQAENVRFLFGAEAEMDRSMTVGISQERLKLMDFVVIPTTHLHLKKITVSPEGNETPAERAALWVKRLNHLLELPLPFHKIGIAHLIDCLIAPTNEQVLETFSYISEEQLEALFRKVASRGAGIELNKDSLRWAFSLSEAEYLLRPYRIAKACGCKFYCGSDAHHPPAFNDAKNIFEQAIDRLELKEVDKIPFLLQH